ncbi:GNS1-like protein [Oopsacas minuta]|uniref:Elongation of very long chain fatty acids protein n=1 Tax=Oopsacas minuta TaxID=111878 RepID=A0AAV7KFR4_9METZ|nr:GNS1-like protein [Oopsacas minuta]
MDWSAEQLIHYLKNPYNIAYDIQGFYVSNLPNSDPRVSNWLLMHSIMPTIYAVGAYLSLVSITTIVSRHLPKMELLSAMRLYNISIILICAYTMYELIVSSILIGQNFWCSPAIYSTDESAVRYARAIWLYYVSKFLEFTDTTFFVLRGKFNQVTFLHVYHHASMPLIWWVGVKWHAGGITHVGPICNSFIHVVMYSYYFLASFGARFQRYLWWKKYLTVMQLAQFHIVLIHTFLALVSEDCGYSKGVLTSQTIYMISLIGLFLNFYFQSYSAKKSNQPIRNGVRKEILIE